MNIRDHIEAGHYERDGKGRALVPTDSGHTVAVCATDRPDSFPIVGWMLDGRDDGCLRIYRPDGTNATGQYLLPPPPRKVKVTRWALMGSHIATHVIRIEEQKCVLERYRDECFLGHPIVELTGEYEEPWS